MAPPSFGVCMKIRIKREFKYQLSATKVAVLPPGVYDTEHDITQHVVDLALRFGKAEIVIEAPVKKVAPENKVVEVAENKSGVEEKSVRRRSTRSKPDA